MMHDLSLKLLTIFLLITTLLSVLPLPALAFSLVPCGSSEYPETCQFKHLIILIVRVINYLISVAALVAMWEILNAGFDLILSVGNSEKIEKSKKRVSNAVVGFGIIILAFIFVNLVINAVFGKPGATRQWWNVTCIYNPGQAGCPFKP